MSLQHFIRRHLLTGLAVALSFCARSAMAQLIVNFDEKGIGTINVGAAQVPLISLGNIIDPFDPSSGVKPLAYNLVGSLPGFPAPVDGDILLSEGTGNLTDVLRFYHGLLMVYSDVAVPPEVPPLADVGFPNLVQPNRITLPETGPETGPNGLFGYAPIGNMPGALSAPIIYNFTSDPVPEPSTFAVAGLGALLLLIRRRKPVRSGQPA